MARVAIVELARHPDASTSDANARADFMFAINVDLKSGGHTGSSRRQFPRDETAAIPTRDSITGLYSIVLAKEFR
ncbi:hypothetical protein B296_00054276 [Ensete ventricosum]|uniref:Uncharacterized protein n=1 Tax=Ensete ventricosum TaxID=4639 RepID=A0A426X4P5_ENSVE|nr:hypothetical protein B296_00054276 [Ensete ventricosum]